MKKIIAACMSLVLLLGFTSGCAAKLTASTAEVPLQPSSTVREPVTVTMFGNWLEREGAGQFAIFKAALAKEFPEITMEYEMFPTGEIPYTDEITRRVEHGREADIIITMDTALGSSGKLLDLTAQEFTRRYSVAAMKQFSVDGSVYFLPGVGNVKCYVYNASQLKAMGITTPNTLDDMEKMMGEVAANGVNPFFLPYEQTKPLFIKALAAGYLATPDGQIWLEDYNNGKATMKGNAHWEETWRRASRMVEAGYITKEDMLLAEGRRIIELGMGNGAMTMISSSRNSFLQENNTKNYEFTLLPLLGEKPGNQTVFSAPTCYIAASARLALPENKAKLDAVLRILDFISTEAGQLAIRGEAPLPSSYLNNVRLELDSHAAEVAAVLKEGSFSDEPVFGRGVENVLGEALGNIVDGTMTAEQALAACDKQNAEYKAGKAPPAPVVIGRATEEFPWVYMLSRSKELAITNFVVDSVRDAVGTDIAIELGTAVRGEFFKGDITDKDIESVIRMDKKLYKTKVTGKQMWDIIDQGVNVVGGSWFIVVSGLKYSYRPTSAGAEGELLTLTTADGTAIDLNKTYEIAVSENQMMQVNDIYNFFGTPCEDVGIMLRTAVAQNIQKQGAISPMTDGRITLE